MATTASPIQRQALRLSYFTVGYNVLEGVVSVVFALAAGSPSLFGFGVDSFVESLSGLVMVWRFRTGEHREQTAIRLVGLALVVLALYVAYESATQLYFGEPPEPSPVGIAIARWGPMRLTSRTINHVVRVRQSNLAVQLGRYQELERIDCESCVIYGGQFG
jgi:hypothetical protein